MNMETAQDITAMYCRDRRPMDAIRTLRRETDCQLLAAKNYLELYGSNGEAALYKKLCEDYVQDKRSLLEAAHVEIRRLQKYAAQLEAEIDLEENEGDSVA